MLQAWYNHSNHEQVFVREAVRQITKDSSQGEANKDNVYLFPNMLDQYQFQLTRLLEAERFADARELLRFLLQCQGEEQRLYEEWSNLLVWLDMAFPEGNGTVAKDDGGEDEDSMRRAALEPLEQDEAYVNQVLYIMRNHPMVEQQLLALERAALLRGSEVDEAILSWLQEEALHPAVQFKALQCLRRRGATGAVTMVRNGEPTELLIEDTPLALDDFPEPVGLILERVEQATEAIDPTLPHFARDLWKECIQFLYGTSDYHWMMSDDDSSVDCFAAALHFNLALAAYGKVNDDDIRDTYGITESLRFKYEQACRAIRQISSPPAVEDE